MSPFVSTRLAQPADEEILDQLLNRAVYRYPDDLDISADVLLRQPVLVTIWEEDKLQGCLGLSLLRPSTGRAVPSAMTRDILYVWQCIQICIDNALGPG